MTVTPDETATPPVTATDLFAVTPTNTAVLAEPEMLLAGLRYLQQRIPEFTQMTWQQKRAHARAASLDPEFLESGLQAAAKNNERVMSMSILPAAWRRSRSIESQAEPPREEH